MDGWIAQIATLKSHSFGRPPMERFSNPFLNGFHNQSVSLEMKGKQEAAGAGCAGESEEAAEKANVIVTQSEQSTGFRERPKCLVTLKQPLKQRPIVASIELDLSACT